VYEFYSVLKVSDLDNTMLCIQHKYPRYNPYLIVQQYVILK